MPTENKPAEPIPSLATGHPLTPDTWTDFVKRLKHDCVGAGVRNHCTSAAIFTVQTRRVDTGYDLDFNPDQACIVDHDGGDMWFSPAKFYADAYECQQAALDASAQEQSECDFADLSESDQWDILAELDALRHQRQIPFFVGKGVVTNRLLPGLPGGGEFADFAVVTGGFCHAAIMPKRGGMIGRGFPKFAVYLIVFERPRNLLERCRYLNLFIYFFGMAQKDYRLRS
jgi:hypothetical protein